MCFVKLELKFESGHLFHGHAGRRHLNAASRKLPEYECAPPVEFLASLDLVLFSLPVLGGIHVRLECLSPAGLSKRFSVSRRSSLEGTGRFLKAG